MNNVELSEDRRHMVITSGERKATLRSARPEGFTEGDVVNAYDFDFTSTIGPNQVNRARRIGIGKRAFCAHFNVGPPTWWLPRIEVGRGKVMIGWLRALVALSWSAS